MIQFKKLLFIVEIFFLLSFLLGPTVISSQDLPQSSRLSGINDFIDELALQKIIVLNAAIKPYGSAFIYQCLEKADKARDHLSQRQIKTLERYLNYYSVLTKSDSLLFINRILPNIFKPYAASYDPLGFFYKDKKVYLGIIPVWGIDYHTKKGSSFFHRWGGARIEGSFHDRFSFYADLRDNRESEIVSNRNYLVNMTGGNYKNAGEYSEMRGGLNYNFKWGSVSLVKDFVEWGVNYNGANIFSNRAPSFTQLKFKLNPVEWFDFNYFHAWVVSDVIDSTRSYFSENGLRRDVMRPKFVAANMYTFMPFKNIHLSVGNSVVYSADSPHPAYLIPFFFYKSVDHWLNSTDGAGSYVGQNSQMFMNLSIYALRSFHFYGSLFVDEFKMARINDPEVHNFWSYKIGLKSLAHFSNDIQVVMEYTRSNPNVYEHNISTTTFESNRYNMGHFLRDNADEMYFELNYRPIDKLKLLSNFTYQRKGPEHGYDFGNDAIKHGFMEKVEWERQIFKVALQYEFLQNSFLSLAYQWSNVYGEEAAIITYSPLYYQGKVNQLIFGFSTGL